LLLITASPLAGLSGARKHCLRACTPKTTVPQRTACV
jgi:hypothetical protein